MFDTSCYWEQMLLTNNIIASYLFYNNPLFNSILLNYTSISPCNVTREMNNASVVTFRKSWNFYKRHKLLFINYEACYQRLHTNAQAVSEIFKD